MKYTVYKTTNIKNGKFYIGKHQTDNINDFYLGSGKAIKAAISYYGKESFVKEILFVFETEVEMNKKEKELVTEDLVNNPLCYNMGIGGEGGPHFKGKCHSAETRKKIKNNTKPMSDNNRKRSSEFMKKLNKDKTFTNETRSKISTKAKLRYNDVEYMEKFKNSLKNRPKRVLSEETKLKISLTLKKRNINII